MFQFQLPVEYNDNIDTTIEQKRKNRKTDHLDARELGLKENMMIYWIQIFRLWHS